VIPLSFAQRRLWFLNRLDRSSPGYQTPVVVRLDAVPDRVALNAALREVADRHQVLRTVFPAIGGEPVRRLSAAPSRPLAVETCAARDLDRLVTAFARRPFDLGSEPPFRARLFLTSATPNATPDTAPGGGAGCMLVLLLHHIAADGWSLDPLLRDLGEAYRARLTGRAATRRPPPPQHADHTRRQHAVLGDPADPGSPAAGQLAYWGAALAGLPARTALPADRPRPTAPGHRTGTVTGRLDAVAHMGLTLLIRRRRADMAMALRAALAATLSAAGAGPDIAIGATVSGRPAELREAVGCFANTLVVRADTSGDPTPGELLERVRDTERAARAHQQLPFDLLVEHLDPDRSRGRHLFFQVTLSLGTEAGPTVRLGDIEGRLVPGQLLTAHRVDLAFHATEHHAAVGIEDGIEIGLRYATELFDASTARLLLGLYLRTLRFFAADPRARLGDLALLSAAERAAVAERHARPVHAAELELITATRS
jgi:hypothetical protein